MATMLTAKPETFFHYTPHGEKKPPPAGCHAIDKQLTAKKIPENPRPTHFLKMLGKLG
jgi:hypothetical protein